MRIGSKLILLVSVMTFFMITLGLMGLYGIHSTDERLTIIYQENLVESIEFTKINHLMEQSMLQVHLATKHDPRLEESTLHANHSIKTHTDAIRKNLDQIDEIWNEFNSSDHAHSVAEKAIVDKIHIAYNTFKKDGLGESIRLLENGQFRETNILAALKLPKLYNDAKEPVESMLKIQLEQAKKSHEEAEDSYIIMIFLVIGSIIGGLLLSLLISFLVIRSITNPLAAAVDRIKDIAEGKGDLTQRIDIKTNDEVGELSDWLNRFIEKVHGIVTEISGMTENVLTASGDLSGSSLSLSAGIEEVSTQASTIAAAANQMDQNFQIISSSVEEMNTSFGEVARNAAEAAGTSNKATEITKQANDDIKALGISAQEIGQVIDSIVNIAGQTNLLALNASIEAASAGDAGRGFAVVASEVKELARQAGESSESIKQKISRIQNSVNSSVNSIGEITNVILKLNDIINTISASTEEQSIVTREIAGNVAQSSQASAQVAGNIEGISAASHEGASNAAKVSSLAGDLEKLSKNLQTLVQQFKI